MKFASIPALERALDGSDEAYSRYYFALYHCLPDEDAGINELRRSLREQYPKNAVSVGRHFVLWGEPACQALRSYYYALSTTESLSDEFRAYARDRQQVVEQRHSSSQALPVSIDLSEGQLSADEMLDFYACLALSNGQIISEVQSQIGFVMPK